MPQQPPASNEQPLGSSTAVIACGALVRELRAVGVNASYLPAPLHSRPAKIPAAVEEAIRTLVGEAADSDSPLERIVLGYGDCGTGGLLDSLMERLQIELSIVIERLPGEHCYSFFVGAESFRALHDEELGTFFLTDFLARHFDQLIWGPLKIEQHPELLSMYFGNYKRVVYLAQTNDPDQLDELTAMASDAAQRLGLEFDRRHTGLSPLREALDHPVTVTITAPGSPSETAGSKNLTSNTDRG